VSAVAQSIILYVILTRRVQLKHQSRLLATLLKTCVATVVMAGVVAAVLQMVPPAPQKDVLTVKALRLLAPMTAGLVAFFGVAAALQVREMHLLIDAMARRLRHRR
jgi:peptidoglycan biosynthesis protein MviN/MurJ (putative lipid II flippase)